MPKIVFPRLSEKTKRKISLLMAILVIAALLSPYQVPSARAESRPIHRSHSTPPPGTRATPTPSPTPTPTPTATPTSTPSPTPTPTPAPTATPTPTPSPTPSPTPTLTPTPTSSPSPTPTSSPQVSIGIYSDPACSVALSSINWGDLSPGATSSLVLYVQNQGSTAVTLSKELSNYNPSTLSTYLTLNWDYSNQALNPGTTLKITLTLIVSSSTPTMASFSFSTTITATAS